VKKVSLFVDVQNIYYTTKSAYQSHFDYNKFWSQATKDRQIVTARAYAIDRGDKKQIEFQNILRAIGFDVQLKPFITRRDGSSKGDWDVGILASGDGDFDLLLKKIKTKFDTNSEVYGVPQLTAASLIAEATTFKPIDAKLLLR